MSSAALTEAEWAAALEPFGLCLMDDGNEVGGGRGLSTAVAVRAGQELLRVPPSAAVVDATRASSLCHFCFEEAAVPLLRCSGCHFACYCSARHQKSAWAEHKLECRMLRHTAPRVPGTTIRLLGRVLRLVSGQIDTGTEASGTEAETSVPSDPLRRVCGAAGVLSLRSQFERQAESQQQTFLWQSSMYRQSA